MWPPVSSDGRTATRESALVKPHGRRGKRGGRAAAERAASGDGGGWRAVGVREAVPAGLAEGVRMHPMTTVGLLITGKKQADGGIDAAATLLKRESETSSTCLPRIDTGTSRIQYVGIYVLFGNVSRIFGHSSSAGSSLSAPSRSDPSGEPSLTQTQPRLTQRDPN
jgi:hypothetical protein